MPFFIMIFAQSSEKRARTKKVDIEMYNSSEKKYIMTAKVFLNYLENCWKFAFSIAEWKVSVQIEKREENTNNLIRCNSEKVNRVFEKFLRSFYRRQQKKEFSEVL